MASGKTPLAFLQPFLRQLALADVAVEQGNAVGRRIGGDIEPDVMRAIDVVVFERHRHPLRHHPPVGGFDRRAEGGRPCLPVRAADDVLRTRPSRRSA